MTETVLLGDAAMTTDYVANGSFASLKANVHYLDEPSYAILLRLVDYNANYRKDFVWVNKESYDFLKKSSVEPGDIIIANVGANAGTVFRAPDLGLPMTLGPNSVLVRAKVSNDYLYYWLISPQGQSALQSIIAGSAQPKFNKTDLRLLCVLCPEQDEQKRIGQFLKVIDEKIELNQRMNKTLEQMGQALFRHYFIDNNETETVKVEDLLLFERGVEPGSKNYSAIYFENSSPFLRVGDLGQRKNNIFVDNDLLKNKFVKFYEILVSFDGAPGLVAVGLEGSYSTGIRKVVIKDDRLSIGYAYFLMKSEGIQGTIERYSEGTTIKHAPRAIENMTAKKPNNRAGMIELQDILDVFINNLLQIQTLTTLRDTLLPRLISGMVKV